MGLREVFDSLKKKGKNSQQWTQQWTVVLDLDHVDSGLTLAMTVLCIQWISGVLEND
jgi:hypothetical protein